MAPLFFISLTVVCLVTVFGVLYAIYGASQLWGRTRQRLGDMAMEQDRRRKEAIRRENDRLGRITGYPPPSPRDWSKPGS